MPLFKLPFEEKRPISVPFAGHAQPLAERVTGCTGVLATGLLGAGTDGLTNGGWLGTGVAIGVDGAGRGGAGGAAGRAVTARGAPPLKRMVCPG